MNFFFSLLLGIILAFSAYKLAAMEKQIRENKILIEAFRDELNSMLEASLRTMDEKTKEQFKKTLKKVKVELNDWKNIKS